jgi:hypothetical protein
MLILPAQSSSLLQDDFTVVNRVRELDIISLYIWEADADSKGCNLLENKLQPDSCFTLSLPPGSYGILAFDEAGNSYGVRDSLLSDGPDTLQLDLEHIMYNRLNVDLGEYALVITNGLQGLALERIELSSDVLPGTVTVGDIRIFPYWIVYLWLDRGTYSLKFTDQAGREFEAESITVTGGRDTLRVTESMLTEVSEPVGMVGEGSIILLIENRLPGSLLATLEILPDNGSAGLYLDGLGIEPGHGIAVALNPGDYSVTATDDEGIPYRAAVQLADNPVYRLYVNYEYLLYDFSFPSGDRE